MEGGFQFFLVTVSFHNHFTEFPKSPTEFECCLVPVFYRTLFSSTLIWPWFPIVPSKHLFHTLSSEVPWWFQQHLCTPSLVPLFGDEGLPPLHISRSLSFLEIFNSSLSVGSISPLSKFQFLPTTQVVLLLSLTQPQNTTTLPTQIGWRTRD